MAKTTFYTHVANPLPFACRLTLKAWRSGARLLVWLDDETALGYFDGLLWSFESTSFVPHSIWLPERAPQPDVSEGVLLAAGDDLPTLTADTVVLNLADAYWCTAPKPPQRVLELVSADLDELAAARARFRAYRQAGFEIEHHNMQASPSSIHN